MGVFLSFFYTQVFVKTPHPLLLSVDGPRLVHEPHEEWETKEGKPVVLREGPTDDSNRDEVSSPTSPSLPLLCCIRL